MAKGHRSQIKKERNNVKDTRPRAKVSFARVSPTKANFVLKAIRGKKVGQALGILAYNSRYGAEVIGKLLRSAVANAENNNGMDAGRLYIEEAYANQGPIMKRIRPRAQGRAFRIEKKTSHITIVLNELKDK
ncbi:50S ribosomal protein L22 [Lachnospiraceae bacterium oral taxon 500]|nr:50S ribosomal protein L22 [Lachnospiraceae bacterium oral taxon 500]